MSEATHVLAGVITDPRGRILLARRTVGRDLAGLWEFPGGKREPGETAEAALARELHEELGIRVEIGAPLICVPQCGPKRLRLDVRHIAAWQGTPKGREGQALAWVPPHKLASYAMPPADRPVVAALLQPDRYLVTPAPGTKDAPWLRALDRALQRHAASPAGKVRVQLRAPGLTATRWRRLAEEAVALCRQADVQALINGDIALARELGIGLHLQARQLAGFRGSERPLPADIPLGASCHTADDLRAAQAMGCDFAVLGPVLPTSSHPDAAGIGWPGFSALREQVSLPIYAIGGLGADDLTEARAHGAQGIAAIRGLWAA